MADSSDLLGAIGKVIRKRREAMGISQTELAERAGLHRTYINNIEGGSKNISIDSLKGIADALNTNISELMLSAEATDDAKPPIKVMLVEDSEPDVFLFKQSLAKITALPTTVEVYEDGKKAQEKIDKLKEASSNELPDIIFLDLNLRGGRSGYDLLIDIKSNDVLRHIPVIILTTSSNPQDVRKTYGHFANSFMTKPVDPQEYQSQVANVLALFTKNMGD